MVATLRVVLDQIATPVDPALAEASLDLARALVIAAPSGCEVDAIVPSGAGEVDVAGLADVRRTAFSRRDLATALQLGAPTGIGGGMIHSPSLFAPLVRHDRVHDNDQTVVTVWDLRAWEAPDELPRGVASWQKAMLKRAIRHADAIVVPTHAHAQRLGELAPKLADRLRVITGAAPTGFVIPTDEVGRRRELDLPEGFILVAGGAMPTDELATGFSTVAASAVDLPVVVIDVEDGHEPAVADLASATGIPEHRLHVRGTLDAHDRGALFGAAVALVAPSRRTAFPWRVVEALALGVPVMAADTAVNREIVVDGGVLGPDADALGAALASGLSSAESAGRLGVLAADRGRAFSWREAADRVWQLHAEL